MPFSIDIVPPLERPRRRASRLALAAALVAVATLLRFAAGPLLEETAPYFMYVGAVVVATWMAGVDGGILAVVLSAAVSHFFFASDPFFTKLDRRDLAEMLVFGGFSLLLVPLVARWRRAERDLRALANKTAYQAEELETLLDTVPAAVFLTHEPDGSRIFGNQCASEYLRIPRGANASKTAPAAEQPMTFRVMKDGREVAGEELPVQAAIARGVDVRDCEIDVVYDDGTRRTFFGNASPLRDEDGAVRGALGAFLDVTERKRVEEALRASDEKYRRLFENMNGVMSIDELVYGADGRPVDWRILDVNPEYERVTGRTREQAVGRTMADIYGVPPAPVFLVNFGHVVETGESVRFEQFFEPLGRLFLVSAFHLGGNRFARLTADVTERHHLERQLQEQREALEHANRVKDEFLATLSHELRTPLNAILGWSDMLRRPGLQPDMQQRAIESINRNARAQAALISDILDVSRIITGKLRLESKPVDLAEVVKAASESVQPAAVARGVTIRTAVESPAMLLGDADRLQQVVWNLLSNSVKFSPHGGRIDVSVRRVSSDFRIVVTDEGTGIAPNLLPHVFDRFRQADSSTTRKQAGLGLGLAIVRHLVELHGGTVSAASAGEGHGATFTVMLPIRAVLEPVAGKIPSDADRETRAPEIDPCRLEGLHVVAVDDQDEARVLIRAVLERYGARVTTCSNAEQAIEAVCREHPDILLADIGMPEVDGYELMDRVRVLPDHHLQTMPAVALTAYGGVHDRARALSAGYAEHVAKPVVPEDLVGLVATLCGGGRGSARPWGGPSPEPTLPAAS